MNHRVPFGPLRVADAMAMAMAAATATAQTPPQSADRGSATLSVEQRAKVKAVLGP